MTQTARHLFVSGRKVSVKTSVDAQALQVQSMYVEITDAWLLKQRVTVHVKTSLDVTPLTLQLFAKDCLTNKRNQKQFAYGKLRKRFPLRTSRIQLALKVPVWGSLSVMKCQHTSATS
jgi:hypothetical protein